MNTTLARGTCVLAIVGAAAGAAVAAPATQAKTVHVTVSGGHTTKAVDNGRPVILVASALGVPEAVFRDAFSRVTPAAAGAEPDPAQVQRNKAALLATLGPYGVTNDELDRVSNHYRYNESAGQLWPTTAAVIRARTSNGKVTGFTVVSGGSGYTSAPKITVPGHPEVKAVARLAYSKTFATNGRIASVRLR